MSNPFQLIIPLKQHTPIIHFQHDQTGATLRATEVRAALNQFIWKDMPLIDPQIKQTHSTAYQLIEVTNEDSAKPVIRAPYKLYLEASEPEKILIAAALSRHERSDLDEMENEVDYLDRSSYFADAKGISDGLKTKAFERGNFSQVRMGLMHSKIVLLFNSPHPDLLALIKIAIPYFFAVKNFGTRQSKGFGCFYPTEYENNFETYLSKCPGIIAIYRKQSQDYKASLKKITEDYQILKSSVTSPGPYKKSLLWQYLCGSHGFKWEKRGIKLTIKNDSALRPIFDELEHTTPENRIEDCAKEAEEKYAYIRVLLGLAEHNEFKTKRDSDKTVKVKISDAIHGDQSIQRYRSPITFKVIGNKIYLIGHPIDERIMRDNAGNPREYSFHLEVDERNRNTTSKIVDQELFTLTTPQQFDLVDFLNHALGLARSPDISMKDTISGYRLIP